MYINKSNSCIILNIIWIILKYNIFKLNFAELNDYFLTSDIWMIVYMTKLNWFQL